MKTRIWQHQMKTLMARKESAIWQTPGSIIGPLIYNRRPTSISYAIQKVKSILTANKILVIGKLKQKMKHESFMAATFLASVFGLEYLPCTIVEWLGLKTWRERGEKNISCALTPTHYNGPQIKYVFSRQSYYGLHRKRLFFHTLIKTRFSTNQCSSTAKIIL